MTALRCGSSSLARAMVSSLGTHVFYTLYDRIDFWESCSFGSSANVVVIYCCQAYGQFNSKCCVALLQMIVLIVDSMYCRDAWQLFLIMPQTTTSPKPQPHSFSEAPQGMSVV